MRLIWGSNGLKGGLRAQRRIKGAQGSSRGLKGAQGGSKMLKGAAHGANWISREALIKVKKLSKCGKEGKLHKLE